MLFKIYLRLLRVCSETKDSSFYIGSPLEFFLSTLTTGICRGHVVRGLSTVHAESPLFTDSTLQLCPSLPYTTATLSGPVIPLQLISSLPLALPVHHTPFRSTTRPSGPFPAMEPAGNARDRSPDHRTGIFHVLDSLTFFLQARSIILLELSILLC